MAEVFLSPKKHNSSVQTRLLLKEESEKGIKSGMTGKYSRRSAKCSKATQYPVRIQQNKNKDLTAKIY